MKKLLLITASLLIISADSLAYQVWNQKANWPATARHRTVAFSIGNKGYMGLGHYNSGPDGNIYLDDLWEYDPTSNTWTQKANFAGGHRYHAVGIAYKTTAFVGTGRDQTAPPSQAFTLENDWWEFDPIANSWTARATFPGTPRRGALSFIIDSLIFVGTGQINSGFTDDFWAYDAENDQWLAGVPPLPGGPRTSAIAFSIDGKGYAGTGGVGCGSTDFYEYKLSTNSWIQRANVGVLIRNESFGFAVNGKGYCLTGDNCSSGTNYKDFWEYDPNLDTWTELPEFPGSARRYMNGFVIGTKVYCGSGTSGVNYSDLWEYDQTLDIIDRDRSLVDVQFYPNPAVDHITFSIDELPLGIDYSDLRLSIVAQTGKLAHEQIFSDAQLVIDRKALAKGLYFFAITYSGTKIRTGKFIFS